MTTTATSEPTTTREERVACIAYIEREDGRILVVWNKRYGCWALPGGLREEHESSLKAVDRELWEETGLRADWIEEIYSGPVESSLPGRGSRAEIFRVSNRPVEGSWHSARPGGPQEKELGCPVTWFTREEFLKWTTFKAFYTAMFEVVPPGTSTYVG